jgi:hypothetical protein
MYWPKFLAGEYNVSPFGFFSNELITDKSVAFNWGGLMGFKSQWQLLPLFLGWAFCLFLFAAVLRPSTGIRADLSQEPPKIHRRTAPVTLSSEKHTILSRKGR